MNIGQILKRSFGPTLNILCQSTHESYQLNLCKTGHNFYSLEPDPKNNPYKIKAWDTKYRPIPSNYTLLQNKLPEDVEFDLVLSQHKFGQIQTLGPIAEKLRIPLINLEHTIAYDDWPINYIQNLKRLRGHYNVFISEYSRDKWLWGKDEANIIRHGIDSDLFIPSDAPRDNCLLSIVNDWINRTVPCGYDTWQEVSQGFPVKIAGATPGLSEAAKSVEDLVKLYQTSRIFLNTSRFSPIPTVLLEAASCECALISTYNPMIAELIENGVNGFISNDNKELRKYCSILLHDEALAIKMGRAARQTILEKFSLTRFIEDWNRLFQEAVAN